MITRYDEKITKKKINKVAFADHFAEQLSPKEKLHFINLEMEELDMRIRQIQADNKLKVFKQKRNHPDTQDYSESNAITWIKMLVNDLNKMSVEKQIAFKAWKEIS